MDSDVAVAGKNIDIERIMEMIPHRYPFLMIDKVIKVIPGASAVGVKNVTIGEPYFQGHFPSRPVMPGVLIIEAMAQTAAVLVIETLGVSAEGRLVYFLSVDGRASANPSCRATPCIFTWKSNITAAMCGSSRPRPGSAIP